MATDYPIPRPPSEQLVDLHVYLLPRESWNEKYRSSYNESISEALSAGFIRVWPELSLNGLRSLIEEELGHDIVPQHYFFLRSVGRCMTQIKTKQELELKCKSFLPPTAWAPEIVVLEAPRDQLGMSAYQSFPGYSPRLDTTQPMNGTIPTHFPQVANHDRMGPPEGAIEQCQDVELARARQSKGKDKVSQDRTSKEKLKTSQGRKNTDQTVSKSKGSSLEKESKNASKSPQKAKTKRNLGKKLVGAQARPSKAGVERAKRLKKTHAAWVQQVTHPDKTNPEERGKEDGWTRERSGRVRREEVALEKERDSCVGNGQLGAMRRAYGGRKEVTLERERDRGVGKGQLGAMKKAYGGRGRGKADQGSAKTTARQSRVIEVRPTVKPDRVGKIQDRTVQTSDIYIGQSPMVQSLTHKGDPLGNMVGIPSKSGCPDAYTNNTNEDSGISEPTPEEYDPDYDRRKSETDDHYYNQLHSNEIPQHQFQDQGRQEEEQIQAEIEMREEERRIEIQERREEERREYERKMVEAEMEKEKEKQRQMKRQEEQRREEEHRREEEWQEAEQAKKQKEIEKMLEDERRKKIEKMKEEQRKEEEAELRTERQRIEEAERMLEEERQQRIQQRRQAEMERAAALPGEDDMVSMDTDHGMDHRGHFPTDEQLRRRAEDELRDYEPQSSWQHEDGGGRGSHAADQGRRGRAKEEEEEMEMASQQAVQDGLKRVHLTPEVHRKAKIGKVRKDSSANEEDMYETDPEMTDLIEQLQAARQERMDKEKEREAMIKRARSLQAKTYDRRYKSRDYWKKRYFDEKKKTVPLEDQVSRVRNQLEVMHRKLLNHLEGKKSKPGAAAVKGPPSKKNDHKIAILKMQHELDEIRSKVDNSRMKLTAEVKLRNQAEAEVRGLKSEVTQRKINNTLVRNQKLAALKTGDNKLASKTPIPALGQGPMSMSAKR